PLSESVLDVRNLRVRFKAHRSTVTALRDVSFTLHAGRTLALVGESGSGKSVSSLAIMGLLPKNGSVSGGAITYRDRSGRSADLTTASEADMRALRGAEIAMIFQEPMSSLNPLFTIGDQIGEMLLLHTDLDARARRQRVLDMLELVEIPAAASRIDNYPHELSGGMR
ncbi:MAG: ABC transporter ATP-binding protein, partial [Ottowia sp.]|nr:ABC transporter ATP-binding protein [Ottowia sp.]